MATQQSPTGPLVHQQHYPPRPQPNGGMPMPPQPQGPAQQKTAAQYLAASNEAVWLQLGALSEMMGELDGATQSYERAMTFNQRSVPAMLAISCILRAKDQFTAAVEYLRNILIVEPTNGEVWSSLGHCYLMMDDLQQAYSAYQQALYHLPDPKEPKLWYGIGILYDRYGSLEHAEEAFSQVMRMEPNFEKANEIYFRLGIIYKQQQKFQQSLECFRYIVTDPPKPLSEEDIWFQIGHVHEQQKDYDSAKSAYTRVLERDPNHAKVLQQLGWLHHQQSTSFSSQEQAIEYLEKSVASDQNDAQSWYLLGRCYMSQQKYPKAYEAYQQAVYRDGRNPTFWCSIGVLYYQINQYRDALDAYSRAIRLNPNISEVWYDLGTLYESCNNQTSDALDAYTRAADLDPTNVHIKARLALLKGQPMRERMGNRRFAQVSTSDEDEDVPPPSSRTRKSEENKEQQSLRQSKRKRIKLQEEEDYEEPEEERKASKRERRDKGKVREAEKPRNDGVEDEEEEEEEEEQPQEDAKPVGEPVRFSGKGRGRRSHYEAFEFDGNKYELEDPVLLTPEDTNQKPYVAIIKEITQSKDGSMMVTGQWFYRPEEADRKGGGNWLSRDTRELFYSFHRDEVPAESVMHKCVVHFVPIHKQLPNRKQHPGFIVQKVYDTVERKLWKLTDKDYEDNKQHEIDLLVQKTRARLGDLPDIEPEETAAREQEDQLKAKRSLRKKNISPLDVSREEDSTTRSDQYVKAETPGSCTSNASEYYNILSKFKALTGETHRDKWLERLLHGLQYICNSADSIHADQNGKGGCKGVDHESEDKSVGTENGSREKGQKNGKSFIWPDTAIAAVTALEKASHDTLSSDFQKYNQKLRQLLFNLKSTALLARRLLNGELEPSKILNMSPNELKEGLTAEEMAKKEPDELEQMQMTDARCSRCNECKVGLRDIIQAGHGDRYQLECIACGHSWYASRDEASSLTIDGPGSAAKSVGIVPLATAKFDSLEKNLLSPRESEKLANDVLKKSSEAYMPVLEAQRSFGKSKTEENSDASNAKKADVQS